MKRNVVLLCVGMLMACLLTACSGGDKPQDESIGQKAGETLTVKSEFYTYAIVWRNLGLAEVREAMHNPQEIDELSRNKTIFTPENGTKVKIVDWKGPNTAERDRLRKVQILEGEFKGNEGFVPYTVLRETK